MNLPNQFQSYANWNRPDMLVSIVVILICYGRNGHERTLRVTLRSLTVSRIKPRKRSVVIQSTQAYISIFIKCMKKHIKL